MKYDEILKKLNLWVTVDDLKLSDEELENLKRTDRNKVELIQNIKTVQRKFAELGNNILQVKQAQDIEVYFNRADIYAINQCLHLASSFVLLGSKSENLSNTILKVRDDCENLRHQSKNVRDDGNEIICEIDPTTIISVAALYYLLIRAEEQYRVHLEEVEKQEIEKQEIDRIKQEINGIKAIKDRFEGISWMLGSDVSTAYLQ